MPLLPASIGIVLNDQREVLLVKRSDVPVWVLPGGGVDAGESFEEAALREIEEETGFRIEIVRKCAEYLPVNALAAKTVVFLCQVVDGQMKCSSESKEVAFFSLRQLPKDFFFPHRLWLEEGLTHSQLIQRKLTEISYWALFKYFLSHPWQVIRFAWTKYA